MGTEGERKCSGEGWDKWVGGLRSDEKCRSLCWGECALELEERGNNEGLDYMCSTWNWRREETMKALTTCSTWNWRREETMKALTTCAQHGTGGERKQ